MTTIIIISPPPPTTKPSTNSTIIPSVKVMGDDNFSNEEILDILSTHLSSDE